MVAFNSTTKDLEFSVSGQSGTTGYVNVYVPKSLVKNASDFKVYIDNKEVTFKYSLQEDTWLLTFTYHHSTHAVTINLNNAKSAIVNFTQILQGTIVGMIITVCIVLTVMLFLKEKYKDKSNQTKFLRKNV
jgi:hypothetical protein